MSRVLRVWTCLYLFQNNSTETSIDILRIKIREISIWVKNNGIFRKALLEILDFLMFRH